MRRFTRCLLARSLSSDLQVFRKQGLATSLTNFVKGIAEAHGIGLYARCGVVSDRRVLDRRRVQTETSSGLS